MTSTSSPLIVYVLAFTALPGHTKAAFTQANSVVLWVFVVACMIGVIAGNIRPSPCLVTVLIEADRRDKANGLVGSATGVTFLVTSVISGSGSPD